MANGEALLTDSVGGGEFNVTSLSNSTGAAGVSASYGSIAMVTSATGTYFAVSATDSDKLSVMLLLEETELMPQAARPSLSAAMSAQATSGYVPCLERLSLSVAMSLQAAT